MEEEHKTTVRLTKELLLAARLKAVGEGVSLSEVIRRFLATWVAGRIETPAKQEESEPEQETA